MAKFIERIATWRTVVILLLLAGLCTAGFQWRERVLTNGFVNKFGQTKLSMAEANDILREGRTPDEMFLPTGARILGYLTSIGKPARDLYAFTEVSLDVVFPLAYGTLLAILVFRVIGSPKASWLIWIPLLAATVDILENMLLAILVWTTDWTAPVVHSGLAPVAAVLISLKGLLILCSGSVIVIGAFPKRPRNKGLERSVFSSDKTGSR